MNMQRRSTATPKYLLLLSVIALATLVSASPALAQSLGTAQNFAVLGGSTVNNTGSSVITGNVGVSPGTVVNGFPPGLIVAGSIQAGNAVASQAQTDLAAVLGTTAGTACTLDLSGQDLGNGRTLTPGVYCFSTSAQLTGILNLDFLGNPNSVFLFKIGSTLTTASGSSVVIRNAGTTTCPPNVFFRVGSSATIGTGTSFFGNILAVTSITLTTGAGLTGRALANTGAVTLDTSTVTPCSQAVVIPPPPPRPPGEDIPLSPMLLLLMGAGLATVALFTLRR